MANNYIKWCKWRPLRLHNFQRISKVNSVERFEDLLPVDKKLLAGEGGSLKRVWFKKGDYVLKTFCWVKFDLVKTLFSLGPRGPKGPSNRWTTDPTRILKAFLVYFKVGQNGEKAISWTSCHTEANQPPLASKSLFKSSPVLLPFCTIAFLCCSRFCKMISISTSTL